MEKHKLDNLFSEKLNGLEQNPSPASWDQIEKSLDQNTKTKIWPWISIAASAALVIASSWYMLNSEVNSAPDNYSYATTTQDKIEIPPKVILVPIIIQVYSTPTLATTASQPIPKTIIRNDIQEQTAVVENDEPAISVADNNILEHNLSPVLKEPLPLTDEPEEIVIASTKGTSEQELINTQKSLTIIYKQGEPEHKSKFTQALNYMGDVRNGDKKLVNFSKIKDSFKSKIKSNKLENSK